jgi:hypothetical protein
MTEAEWLTCVDPGPLLTAQRGQVTDRKARLFAVACCRRIESFLVDPRAVEALAVAERFADGEATDEQRSAARKAAQQVAQVRGTVRRPTTPKGDRRAASAVYYAVAGEAWDAAWHARDLVLEVRAWQWGGCADATTARQAEQRAQAELVREILGNPFQPVVLDPAWLTWNGGLIAGLAQTIYTERAFDRLPILADALEDADCADRRILGHCRTGHHVRGCWVIDLLLGKG